MKFFKIDQVVLERGLVLNMGQLWSIPFVIAGLAILIGNSIRARVRSASV